MFFPHSSQAQALPTTERSELRGEDSDDGPANRCEASGDRGLRDLRFDVVHQVAARTHGTEHCRIRDGRTLVAVNAAIDDCGKAQGHKQFGMRQAICRGHGPSQWHGKGECHRVRTPTRARGKGDSHGQ